MGTIADRAEQIAGFLVAETVGAEATAQGPSAAMDYELRWQTGDRGVLEVTLVPDDFASGGMTGSTNRRHRGRQPPISGSTEC